MSCVLMGMAALQSLCLPPGPYFSAFTKAFVVEIYNVQLKVFHGSTDEKGKVFLRHVVQVCVIT